jgi:phosphatidylglycerol:prolipoprotein diacylglycerol transferase
MNFLSTMDTLIVAVPLAHAFGRLGCFFAGCCYGRHAPDLPWAITFSNPASLAPKNIPLHPTQIYACLGAIGVFLIIFAIKRFKKFDGQVLASYLMIYPINRIIEERFRGDLARKFVPIPGAPDVVSTGDLVSILLLIAGIAFFFYTRNRHFEKMT